MGYSIWTFLGSLLGIVQRRPATMCPAQLDIIGAGLPRTGTQWLTHHFEQTHDQQVYNTGTMVQYGHLDLVTELACTNNDTQREALLDAWYVAILETGATMVMDTPGCFFYRELAARNGPNTTIVLSQRPADEWEQSVSFLLHQFAPLAGWPYRQWVDLVKHSQCLWTTRLNCTMRARRHLSGVVQTVTLTDPVACQKSAHHWNREVEQFARDHEYALYLHDLSTQSHFNKLNTRDDVLWMGRLLRWAIALFPFLFIVLFSFCTTCLEVN